MTQHCGVGSSIVGSEMETIAAIREQMNFIMIASCHG